MHNIKINPRTLENYMKKLHLVTFVGQKKKKNTNVKFEYLIKRDCISLNNAIYAIDVTYIPAPKNINQNHIYLSVIIEHKPSLLHINYRLIMTQNWL
ncbi:hypothetical protein [Mycoplasmopsis cynos]|uniref:hypothetical protein n=1 Tax=Mycoplasmopsis cynos TaxID=171284 RepID=UPI002AFE23C0|nr:hypothetical protein [Mycoplasmopsis cynos]WQQ17341.1 hypothetical protein RRG56_02145 [Mycoplasmopsis cynos]